MKQCIIELTIAVVFFFLCTVVLTFRNANLKTQLSSSRAMLDDSNARIKQIMGYNVNDFMAAKMFADPNMWEKHSKDCKRKEY